MRPAKRLLVFELGLPFRENACHKLRPIIQGIPPLNCSQVIYALIPLSCLTVCKRGLTGNFSNPTELHNEQEIFGPIPRVAG